MYQASKRKGGKMERNGKREGERDNYMKSREKKWKRKK